MELFLLCIWLAVYLISDNSQTTNGKNNDDNDDIVLDGEDEELNEERLQFCDNDSEIINKTDEIYSQLEKQFSTFECITLCMLLYIIQLGFIA